MGELLKVLLIAGVVVIVIGAICRELLCWFWKINLQVSLLEDISKKLDALGGVSAAPAKLTQKHESSRGDSADEQVLCANCGTLTSTAGEFCEQCGRKWETTAS
jgi:hypothetical protein